MTAINEQSNKTDVDVCLTNKEVPMDIEPVHIDKAKPVEERLVDYLQQVQNPYLFLCGKTSVEILFATSGASTLEGMVLDYFIEKKARNESIDPPSDMAFMRR